MTKEQLLEKLQSSEELIRIAYIPVSEVITWINELEEPRATFTNEQIKEFAETVTSQITDMGLDLVDDYDLSMNYREVELDSIDFDSSKIQRELRWKPEVNMAAWKAADKSITQLLAGAITAKHGRSTFKITIKE